MKIRIRTIAFVIIFSISRAFTPALFAQNMLNNNAVANNTGFFIENKGQWDKQVRFLARLNDMNVWITEKGVVYDFFRVERNTPVTQDPFSHEPDLKPDTNSYILGHVIHMLFSEGNHIVQYVGSEKLKPYYNYFFGKNPEKWTSYVSLFKEVTAKEIYPGINARFYIESGMFRYDLIVQPGTDISGFRLKFEGQNGMSLNKKGELILNTSIGDLLNSNLFAYQEIIDKNKSIKCKFVKFENGSIGFKLGKYDTNLQLIIDPLVYSTFLGGSNNDDLLNSIVVDKFRNAYVAGVSNATNYPTTTGAYKNNHGLFRSGIITELDAGGFPVFSTYIGDSTTILDVAIDTIGNVYITGWTGSHNYPVTSGAFQVISKEPGAGGAEGFVTKLSSDGSSLIYSTFLGGSGFDFPSRIKVDKQQNAFITGTTYSNNFPLSNGALQINKSGFNDCFITKLDKLGKNIIYSTFLGGKSIDVANDIAIDSIGDAYIVGKTQSSDFYTTSGSFQPDSIVTTVMGFLSKLNRFGTNIIYSTFLAGKGGNGLSNNAIRVGIDSSGCAYVTGNTNSDSFPVTSGSYQTSTPSAGKTHAFITKFDKQAATLVYSTYFGGDNDDYANDIDVDPLGNAIIGGFSNSTNLPFTPDAVQQLNRGSYDLFVTMLNPYGTKLFYSTYFGGDNMDNLTKLFYDSLSNIYLTGQTTSNDFPVSSGAYQQVKPSLCSPLSPPCYTEGFVTRINTDPPAIITDPVSGFPTCAGTYISVPYSVRSKFDTGNTFLLQLSDSNGNFNKPLQIAARVSRVSGIFTAHLPIKLKHSTKYRFRVLGTNPSITASDNGFDLTIDSAVIKDFTISDTSGCLNSNRFLFSFDTTYISGILKYRWIFGDGDTSDLLKPQHNYKTADTFTAGLELTNIHGCIYTLTKRIIVFPAPNAKFVITDSTECLLGNKFEFINKSTIKSGNLTSNWSFGDGDSAFTFNATHSYKVVNSYNISLKVITDKGCKDSTSKTVNILPSAIAGFSTQDTAQCLNGNYFPFTNLTMNPGGNKITFIWKFGDGSSDTSTNPSHVYNTDSIYSVQLKAISDINCNDSIVKNMIVGVPPLAAFSVNDTIKCLTGNKFVFKNHTKYKKPAILSYLWDFGDGNSDTSANSVHSYLKDSTYIVQLNATTEVGCKDSAITTLFVIPKPNANFNANDSEQCIAKNNFIFENRTTKIDPVSRYYFWKFGDGNADTAMNPVHSYAFTDTFAVELIAISNYGCRDTITKNVYVHPMPVADFDINSNPQSFPGNKFIFTNLSDTNNQGNYSWLWTFGDSDTSILKDGVHSYKTVDTFLVTLYVSTDMGCKDTMTKSVWLNNPKYSIDFTTDPVCLDHYAIFRNTSTIQHDSFLYYLWDFGDKSAAVKAFEPQHQYKDTGIYTVKMSVLTAVGIIDAVSHTITVLSVPKVKISYRPDTVLIKGRLVTLSVAGKYFRIIWSTGARTPGINVDSTDLYSVRVVDYHNCDATDSIYIRFYDDQNFNAMNLITPNGDGINDLWKIFGIEKYQPCKLVIYNRWGDALYSSSNYQNNWDGKYKGKILPAGAYYFVLEARDGKVYKGVVNIFN